MAKPQAPSELVGKTKEAIAFISPRNLDADDLPDTHRLETDCGLYAYARRSLVSPFERTARKYEAAAKISPSACSKLRTVKAAIKLVAKAAGFSYE